jgi:hemoglobin-like flavoprotein
MNIQMIQSSFEVVKPVAYEAVSYFYENLFFQFPQTKILFDKVDLEKQKTLLIQSLAKIVEDLPHKEKLESYLQQMGKRHERYGVTDEHYGMVGKSLIETFRYFFKDQWTLELEDQWILLIGYVAEEMIKGSRHLVSSKNDAPKIVSLKNVHLNIEQDIDFFQENISSIKMIARDLLIQTLNDEFDKDILEMIKKKVHDLVLELVREELSRLQGQYKDHLSKKDFHTVKNKMASA